MVQCIHCNHPTDKGHLKRKKLHLSKCDAYQSLLKRKKLLLDEPFEQPVLPFKSVTLSEKAHRERLLARAIYNNGLPLSIVDPVRHPEWSDFIRSFDGSWHPPSRERLGGVLLDEEYERVGEQVRELLKGERINLTADESTAGNSDRVANIAVNTAAGGSFHLQTTFVANVAACSRR
jgi:hypothetical protein